MNATTAVAFLDTSGHLIPENVRNIFNACSSRQELEKQWEEIVCWTSNLSPDDPRKTEIFQIIGDYTSSWEKMD